MCSDFLFASFFSTHIQMESFKWIKTTIFVSVHISANNKFWTFYVMVIFCCTLQSIVCSFLVHSIWCVCFYVVGDVLCKTHFCLEFLRCFSWWQKIETCVHYTYIRGIQVRRPAQIIVYTIMRDGCSEYEYVIVCFHMINM